MSRNLSPEKVSRVISRQCVLTNRCSDNLRITRRRILLRIRHANRKNELFLMTIREKEKEREKEKGSGGGGGREREKEKVGESGRFTSVTDVKVLADCAYPMSLRTNP